MHSKKESILKRWHTLTIRPADCKEKWQGQYWEDRDNCRVVSCRQCRSFNEKNQSCGINFGSPLRKCVVSSIEAHFNDCKDKNVLEIGFGRFNLARKLIERSGGTWSGVEPTLPESRAAGIGKGGYGHATDLPFPENSFEMIFGVQSIEHWGQKAGDFMAPSSYEDCVNEIGRVLKPGGKVYLDAPAHLHGHEMFIMGDVERVRRIFPESQWRNVQIEKWREDFEPLPRYFVSDKEFQDWAIEVESYPEDQVAATRAKKTVWLMVITAEKK